MTNTDTLNSHALAAAARGAAALDAYFADPAWRERINPLTVDVASKTDCPLGQVFHDFAYGVVQLGIANTDAIDLGFERKPWWRRGSYSYDDLNAAWLLILGGAA